jgi:hypothetical protein
MRLARRKTAAPVNKEREFAAPLFKNSLLAWHARRKAQGVGQPPACPQPKPQAAPA